MAEGSGVKTVLLYGCFGCLGLVVIGVLAVGLVVIGARSAAGNEEITRETRTPTLPAPVTPPGPPAGTDAPVGAIDERMDAVGVVTLDLSQGEFHVEPARAGEGLEVEAEFDKLSFVLEAQLEHLPDGTWHYRVSFRKTRSGLITGLSKLFGGSTPVVRVYLPRDVPLDLRVRLDSGGAEVELGGLWLTRAELTLDKGGFEVAISEPLRRPIELFELSGTMGGFDAEGIGNASPRKLAVDFRMGGLMLDLRGAWLNDSEITLRSSMGGGMVRLPRDVMVEGLPGELAGVNPLQREVPLPTLRFSASSAMGELEFER